MADTLLGTDEVQLLQCNLDDMTGEALGYALERLLAAGALDVWYTPIYAKKNRPAVMLSVLCRLADEERMTGLVLTETTSLGVRRRLAERVICERETMIVETALGAVRCKVKRWCGRVQSVKPEFDDCARLAHEHALPLEQVTEMALRAFWAHAEQDDIA